MAAGHGMRLRPLTDRWPKPILPIDGRPVVVTLLHDLVEAGISRITVVTGHLSEQVEALLAPLPYDIRFVRQPEPLGSADAVCHAGLEPPFLVVAADTVFAPGDLTLFVRAAGGADGAIAIRRQAGRPDHTRVRIDKGRLVRANDPGAPGGWTAAPLLALDAPVARFLDPLPGNPPFELTHVFQNAIDAGAVVSAIQIRRTRDLTTAADLVTHNFPYLA